MPSFFLMLYRSSGTYQFVSLSIQALLYKHWAQYCRTGQNFPFQDFSIEITFTQELPNKPVLKIIHDRSKTLDNPTTPMTPLISVVIPIYSEEANVIPLAERLRSTFHQIGCAWEIVFAMDPCPDRTKDRILDLINKGFPIRLITFSRRIGKPLSVLAGLDHSHGDAVVVIDADLQDPPELIVDMFKKWREGYKVVIAQRTSRKGESTVYLKCAQLFYWLFEKIAEVNIARNSGDFRLLDARVVKEIRRFRERHGFLRGITATVGFSTAIVPFDREPRHAGKAQISLLGAVTIALDGIIPFSRVPIRLMLTTGICLMILAFGASFSWLLVGIFSGFGAYWPMMILSLIVVEMSGLIVTCLGILGEYLVRTYEESRERPLYIIDELIDSTNTN